MNNSESGLMYPELPQQPDTSVLERLSVEIVLGMSKEESMHAPLTAEQSAAWDRMVVEIKEIHAKGYTVDIVSEIP